MFVTNAKSCNDVSGHKVSGQVVSGRVRSCNDVPFGCCYESNDRRKSI